MDRIGDRLQIAKPSTTTRSRSMTHATPCACRIQQNSVLYHCQNSSYLDVFNLVTSDALFDRIESLLPEHRERLFPPTETLSMFVTQALNADRSCQTQRPTRPLTLNKEGNLLVWDFLFTVWSGIPAWPVVCLWLLPVSLYYLQASCQHVRISETFRPLTR